MADPTLAGVSAGGTAGTLLPSLDVTLAGVPSPALAAALPVGNIVLTGASATGAAHAPSSYTITASLVSARSQSVATALTTEAPPVARFPVARLMRNTKVPAAGAMDNTAVAVIGSLYPAGPRQPASNSINLVGVVATSGFGETGISHATVVYISGVDSAAAAGAVTTT